MGLPIPILPAAIAMAFVGHRFDTRDGGRCAGPLFILAGAVFVVGAALG